MTRTRRTITCSACGNQAPHAGHGWCRACCSRWNRAGRPASGPPPVRPRPVIECGTPQGYDRHTYRKERACDPCREAHAAQWRARYGGRKVPLQPCGTPAAYDRHRSRGEKPCRKCEAARLASWRASWARRKQQRRTRRLAEWTDVERQAAVIVANNAASKADCRALLEALGLASFPASRHEQEANAA